MPVERLRFTIGDLAERMCDAVVNPTNAAFLLGHAGVSGALLRAGGEALARACAGMGDRQQGPVRVTGAGRLPARYVIHVASPVWRGGVSGEQEALAQLHEQVLEAAERLDCRTIALPAIGCGAHSFPSDAAAEAAVPAIERALGRLPGIERVELVFASAGCCSSTTRRAASLEPVRRPGRGAAGGASPPPARRPRRRARAACAVRRRRGVAPRHPRARPASTRRARRRVEPEHLGLRALRAGRPSGARPDSVETGERGCYNVRVRRTLPAACLAAALALAVGGAARGGAERRRSRSRAGSRRPSRSGSTTRTGWCRSGRPSSPGPGSSRPHRSSSSRRSCARTARRPSTSTCTSGTGSGRRRSPQTRR